MCLFWVEDRQHSWKGRCVSGPGLRKQWWFRVKSDLRGSGRSNAKSGFGSVRSTACLKSPELFKWGLHIHSIEKCFRSWLSV